MEENKNNTNESITTNEVKKSNKITTAQAILVAGFFIMIGIVVSQGGFKKSTDSNSLSEKVGIAQDKLFSCIADSDLDTLGARITNSVESAMKSIPEKERGTPYTVVLVDNVPVTQIRGAANSATLSSIIENAKTTKNIDYKGDIAVSEDGDHIYGDPTAKVTLIEYSDYECPYCKQFQPILKKAVDESNGSIRWIYRHYPIHQHSFEKLAAAECVAKLKGNDAFWKYSDLLFSLLKTGDESISEQL